MLYSNLYCYIYDKRGVFTCDVTHPCMLELSPMYAPAIFYACFTIEDVLQYCKQFSCKRALSYCKRTLLYSIILQKNPTIFYYIAYALQYCKRRDTYAYNSPVAYVGATSLYWCNIWIHGCNISILV